jgi:K+ transporter
MKVCMATYRNGHKVIFADKNKRNFNLDNLILVADSEALIMNTNKLIYEEAELTKSGALIAKIIDKTRKLERRNK